MSKALKGTVAMLLKCYNMAPLTEQNVQAKSVTIAM